MNKIALAAFFLLFAPLAKAEIECVGKNSLGQQVKVYFDQASATIKVQGPYQSLFFDNLHHSWDGSKSALATGSLAGALRDTQIAIKYDYKYGQISNVLILADFSRNSQEKGQFELWRPDSCEGIL